MRSDGRANDELRPVKLTRGFTQYAEGSVLIEIGNTRVLCNASVEDGVPKFLRDTGKGWVTAEYSMLPRATDRRSRRESSTGRVGGRTHEIQRLIGRSLRAVTGLEALGERTIWLDCDVLQADGGTRTASITGAFVALYEALKWMRETGRIEGDELPVTGFTAGVSVGIVGGEPMLDLCYSEDSSAQVDMNLVMTDAGRIIEIQGTGEESTFSRSELQDMLKLGTQGIEELIDIQKKTLTIE